MSDPAFQWQDAIAEVDFGGSRPAFDFDTETGMWTAYVSLEGRPATLFVTPSPSAIDGDEELAVAGLSMAPSGDTTVAPDPETLTAINELNSQPGIKYRLAEGGDGHWAFVAEVDLTDDQARSGSLQTAFDRLTASARLTGSVLDALAVHPPPAPTTGLPAVDSRNVRTSDASSWVQVLIAVALVVFAIIAYRSVSHPDGAATGPADPTHAIKAPPAQVLAVAQSMGMHQPLRAVLDRAATGGPVWFVYHFAPTGQATKAVAVDAHTFRQVQLYKRLRASGAYRYLSVAMTRSDWVTEGILLAIGLVLLAVWGWGMWLRTLVIVWGDPGRRFGAGLARVLWAVGSVGLVVLAGVLAQRAAAVRSPQAEAAAAVFGIPAFLVWVYSGVGVARAGAQRVEDEAESVAALDGQSVAALAQAAS